MLNSLLWKKSIVNKIKILIFKLFVQSVMLYGSESIGRYQVSKLLARGSIFGGGQQKKSRKEKIMSLKIRKFVNVQHIIVEVIEKRRLKWFGHLKRIRSNRIPKMILE